MRIADGGAWQLLNLLSYHPGTAIITFAVLIVRQNSVATFAAEIPNLRTPVDDVIDGRADLCFT